jgi:shikimate kinase/3-dehydroquinate synthase
VIADVAHLTTIEARQIAAGLAEAVKIAVATDRSLLEHLERSASALSRRDPAALATLVRLAVSAKIRVVRDDEREAGRRALLNVGHTIGHAIEAFGGFDRWLHGEAVALGTVAELRGTTALGWTEQGLVERVESLLSALGLPTRLDPELARAAWPFALADKKRGGAALKFPVVTAAGVGEVREVPMAELGRALVGR